MRHYLRIGLAALGAVATFVLGMGLVAQRADATPVQGDPVCANWKLRGASGMYPEVVFGGKPDGAKVVSASEVRLKKPAGEGLIDPGVEFASFNLGVKTTTETYVTVNYALADGASTTAGAIRLFGYPVKQADTLHDAPMWVDIATTEGSGTLQFTVPGDMKIGTLGLVYDASNNTKGTVTFTNLMVGDRPVSFVKCPESTTSPSASVSPSGSVSPSASASASTSPSASTSATPRPSTTVVSGSSLPLTGPGIGLILVAGVSVLVVGIGLTLAARRRKVTYRG